MSTKEVASLNMYCILLLFRLHSYSYLCIGFIIHVSQIFPQISQGIHRNPINFKCRHLLLLSAELLWINQYRSIRMQKYVFNGRSRIFPDEHKSGSRGLQGFDVTILWLLVCLEYSCLLLHVVVRWSIKAGCIHMPAELRVSSNNVDPSVLFF